MSNGKLYKGGYTIHDYENHVIAVSSEGEVSHYKDVTEAHQDIDEMLDSVES